MKKFFSMVVLLLGVALLASCAGSTQQAQQPTAEETSGPIQIPRTSDYAVRTCDPRPVEYFNPQTGEVKCGSSEESATSEVAEESGSDQSEPETTNPPVPQNNLEAPVLHHADSHAPEEGYGSFDVGVNAGQIGLAFGVHIRWPEGELDAGGEGCDLVMLLPGWYENLQVLDGRYEVYDIPSEDYEGWVEVLGQQRADEQAANYSCPGKDFEGIPQWDSPHSSPPQ